MKVYNLFFAVLILLSSLRVFAQPVIGEWTDYQSYARASQVADAGNKVYCATEGGLFVFDKTDNSIRKMSGINGLSDTGIQQIAYSSENDVLLIAYQNANLDLLSGNKIVNLSDIKRKQLAADKTIHSIYFSGNLAYLSCGFGIVVVNLEKDEIKDTYFIGPDGSYLSVFDLTSDGNYLWAATATGVYKAGVSDPNLQNYSNWKRDENIPHFDQKFSKIKYFAGHILANYTTDKDGENNIYQLNGSDWREVLFELWNVADISIGANNLVVAGNADVWVFDQTLSPVEHMQKYVFADRPATDIHARCAVVDARSVLWVADQNYGLVKIGSTDERIVPEGPVDNTVFSLSVNGGDLWVSTGGYDGSWGNIWQQPKFQLQRDGRWSVFDKTVFPAGNDFRDIVAVVGDPKDPDHFFAGSWGGGVLEFRDGKFFKRFDNFNSTLQTALPDNPGAPFVRVGGMTFDSEGNLWVTNSGVAKVLSEYNPADGTWKAFDTPEVANNFTIGKIVLTQDQDKWILVPRAKGYGLYIVSKTGDQTKAINVVARFVNSDGEFFFPMSDVYALAVGLDGEIWVGTSTGVATYSNPERVWTDKLFYAARPGLNLHDQLFHPLLEKEVITAIAVDGANRKWIGTRSSGVFLISADGQTEIHHFDTENSPLPGNSITDIAINQKSGEVFIATTSGLISYMGEAISGSDSFSDVYVYPNPVRETYSGPIVVKGLLENTDVKITDVTGNLVYKTKSLGGQAVWDGKNLNGNRCKTGVYLVFLTNPSGDQTKITKLLFIH
jgi:hypothetical protein